jgi:hypothetical protein
VIEVHILGLIISIFFYISLIIILGLYVYNFVFKNYKQANSLLMILFLHGLVVVMALSWALIIMSGGYGVILELYVNNDYSWLLFVFIPILALIIVVDQFTKRHIPENTNKFFIVARFLLPVFAVLVISVATFLIYSNCSYFVYLSL